MFRSKTTTLLCAGLGTLLVLLLTQALRSPLPHQAARVPAAARPSRAQRDATSPAGRVTIQRRAPTNGEQVSSLPYNLSADAEAMLTEEVELNHLARNAGLSLTGRQLERFASVTSMYQQIRHRYEATIARIMPLSTTARLQISIPMYPDAGDKMRILYYAELSSSLGDATAKQIESKLGAALESRFAGFGWSKQVLDIETKPAPVSADYVVNATAVYWNGIAVNPIASRRETHFLPIEDPTGEEWGPMTALFTTARRS